MILVFPLENIFFLKKEKFKDKVEIYGIFFEQKLFFLLFAGQRCSGY
jgi:hypothetical protein